MTHGAARVVIGAVVNAVAAARTLRQSGLDVQLICAGTDGAISREDVLCAGLIILEMQREPSSLHLSDSAVIARDFALHQLSVPHGVLLTLRDSHGGRNLVELGYDADIERCAERDLFDIVPEYDAATNRLTICSPRGFLRVPPFPPAI